MKKLCFLFLVIVLIPCITLAEEYTPSYLAEQFTAMSEEDFPISAEYHESGNFITMTLRSEMLSPALWSIISEKNGGKDQYELTSNLSSNLKSMLNVCGYADTTVVTTFQLSDGTAVLLLIDGKDFSNMIVPQ